MSNCGVCIYYFKLAYADVIQNILLFVKNAPLFDDGAVATHG